MSKFCRSCGVQLSDNAKFCKTCGTPMAISQPVQAQHTPTQMSDGTAEPAGIGEVIFAGSLPKVTAEILPIPNPFKVLFSGGWNVIRGIGLAFRDKKKWIPALIMAVTWFVLTLLPALKINTQPVRALSWLTFARGGTGMSGDSSPLQMAGGIVGKGVVASLVFSIFSGGNFFKKIGGGLKTMVSSVACKNLGQTSALLGGAGLALVFYNFMAGFASLSMSMAGISAFLLSLRALGSRAGFLRSFFGSLTAKKMTGGKKIDSLAVNRVIAGITVGFALSIPLSALNIFTLPYILGALLIIIGLILGIAGKTRKEATTI